MSPSSANGVDRAQSDPLSSLIARLPDPQDRDWYAGLVAYIQSLPPTDELVKVAQLFGFLTMMGHQLPDAIAAEQNKMREFLSAAYSELHQEIKINESLHEQLHRRLSKLPDEITAGVEPAAIAKAMSESFRQQIAATGIQDTSRYLTDATRDLKRVTAELDAVIRPVIGRYNDLATDVGHKVSAILAASDKIKVDAYNVNLKNEQLLKRLREWEWWILPGIVLLCLLVGGFCGALREQHTTAAQIGDLQEQIHQLQETIKALPAALAPPSAKKPKKNN